jgi:hypothetical protein
MIIHNLGTFFSAEVHICLFEEDIVAIFSESMVHRPSSIGAKHMSTRPSKAKD